MRSQKNGRNEDPGRGLEGWGGWKGNSLMFIEHLWTQPHFIPPVNLTAASWEENRLYCCTNEELDCWKSELFNQRIWFCVKHCHYWVAAGVGGLVCDGGAEAALTACAARWEGAPYWAPALGFNLQNKHGARSNLAKQKEQPCSRVAGPRIQNLCCPLGKHSPTEWHLFLPLLGEPFPGIL